MKTTPPTLASARFWAAVLERPLPEETMEGYVVLDGTPAWSFFTVPEPKSSKNRVHVDLAVPDLAKEVDRILALGATKLGDFDEAGFRWTTLADPEGNEFDVVAA